MYISIYMYSFLFKLFIKKDANYFFLIINNRIITLKCNKNT